MGIEDDALEPGEQSVESVLMSVVARYNETRENRVPITDRTRFDLQILDSDKNNQLVVFVEEPVIGRFGKETFGGRYINIGHYDFAQKKFLVYPELISPPEFNAIEQLALQRREESKYIETDYDYDDDVISQLLKRHRDVLREDDLIYKIVERHNELPDEERDVYGEYAIDNSTSYYIALAPKVAGYDRKHISSTRTEDLFVYKGAIIVIAFQGNKNYASGIVERNKANHLPIGYRDLDDPKGGYVPSEQLVTDAEFAKIVGLVEDMVRVKATSHPNLDTERVALRVKPV